MLKSSPSVQRNKEPIRKVLEEYINGDELFLEIGSGTGEHAIDFTNHFPKIEWITTDLKENHPNIKEHLKNLVHQRVAGPYYYEAGKEKLPFDDMDYVFTANTLHIMSWKNVKALAKDLGQTLLEGTLIFIYGPFNYNGEYTSESNEKFDQWLKERNSLSGIRHFEDVKKLMEGHGLFFMADHEMPANNRLLVFSKSDSSVFQS